MVGLLRLPCAKLGHGVTEDRAYVSVFFHTLCNNVVCPFAHRTVLVLYTRFSIFQDRHALVGQLIERAVEGHTPAIVKRRPSRGKFVVKAPKPYHERNQPIVMRKCGAGHNGIVLGDSRHVIAPRTQRHFLAVGGRDAEVLAIMINDDGGHRMNK